MNNANLTEHKQIKKLVSEQKDMTFAAMKSKATELVNGLISDWEKAGGCKNCNGFESVLTWATLDGEGYDEFGICPKCTEQSKKAGTKPGHLSRSGSRGGHVVQDIELAKQKFSEIMKPLVEAFGDADHNYSICIGDRIKKEDYVIVTKGRKVPVGTHGVVVGFSSNQWGEKVGVIDGAGKMHWTAIGNVERCLGMDGETKRPAFEEYIKSNNSFRKSKGLKPSTVTVAMLMLK